MTMPNVLRENWPVLVMALILGTAAVTVLIVEVRAGRRTLEQKQQDALRRTNAQIMAAKRAHWWH